MSPEVEALKVRRGLIATVILTGTVEAGFSQCHEDMRAFHITNGFLALEYRQFHAVLVEAGRDAVIQHMLKESYEFCVQIDADAEAARQGLARSSWSMLSSASRCAASASCSVSSTATRRAVAGASGYEVELLAAAGERRRAAQLLARVHDHRAEPDADRDVDRGDFDAARDYVEVLQRERVQAVLAPNSSWKPSVTLKAPP